MNGMSGGERTLAYSPGPSTARSVDGLVDAVVAMLRDSGASLPEGELRPVAETVVEFVARFTLDWTEGAAGAATLAAPQRYGE